MALLHKLRKATAIEVKASERFLTDPPPSVIGVIDQVLDGRKVDRPFFRPSMLFGCERQNVFHYGQVRQQPSQQNNQLMRILDNGTAVHEAVQSYLSNHPDLWFAKESRIMVEVEGALIRGSCDGVMVRRTDGYRWGVEIKTINAKGFKELEGPKEAHVLQASVYARLQGLWWITILYWNKDNQALKEYPVAFDPKLWDQVKERVQRLKAYVDAGEIPAYDAETCSTEFCGYVEHCRENGGPE